MDTPDITQQKTQLENQETKIYQQRLDSVLFLSRKFINAECEEELITPLLREAIKHTRALGASFVPLDERGVPLSAITQGIHFSETEISAWVEYLASPSVHGRCRTCNQNHPGDETCPLLVKHPFSDIFNLVCLHIYKGNHKFGVLNLYIPNKVLLEEETQNFLQILVNETALAIDGLRLREKERQKLRQLEAAMQRQSQTDQDLAEIEINAILQERTRLAREFHDGLAQVLGYVKLQLSQIRDYLRKENTARIGEIIQDSYQAISDAYVDTREAIDDLHLNILEENFLAWLQQVGANFEINHKIPVHISPTPDRLNLPPEIQLQLARITQEALSNIRKHAKASHIQINFRSEDGYLIFEIQDDGQGFTTEDVFEPSQHGLKSMRERAALISTGLEVISWVGQGTTIRMRIPENLLEIQP